MPEIDIDTRPCSGGTGYPQRFKNRIGTRLRKRPGNAGWFTQFGVNLNRLAPDAQSVFARNPGASNTPMMILTRSGKAAFSGSPIPTEHPMREKTID